MKMKRIALISFVIIVFSSLSILAQKTEVNLEKSTLEWFGKKVGGKHHGEIQLKSGYLEVQGDRITNGVIVVDMTSITNTDLENEEYNQKLVGHLKSDDFFGVEKYPTSKLVVSEGSDFTNGKATIRGEITIKGTTEPISFDVEKKDNTYTAKLSIDRSKFDVRYGSPSFFNNLGDKAIDDIFTLEAQLLMK
jgi:polyisoprenoid-binding protein YceI